MLRTSARALAHPGIAALFLAAAGSAAAQPVISSPTSTPLLPPGLRAPPPPAPNAALPPARPLSSSPTSKSPFRWGPITVQPHLFERFLYSDGLQVRPGRPSNSYINTFAPGVLVDIGKNWSLDYVPTWTVYTNHAFRENVDHALNFAGMLVHQGWAFQVDQTYATTTNTLIETARQTSQEMTSTRLGLVHNFSQRLSLVLSASQRLQFVAAAPDYYTWIAEAWMQYRLGSHVEIGGGLGTGYTDVVPGANMAFVQPQGKIIWKGSGKLSADVHGGYEIRQIYARGISAKYTPVFGVSVQYQPFEFTRVDLSAERTVAPSVLRNQINDNTSWHIGGSQRVLRHFTLSGSYGEQISGYRATVARVSAGRKDNSYSYNGRIGTTFLRRGSISFVYQGSHNSSNSSGFGFTSTQTGVEIGFRY